MTGDVRGFADDAATARYYERRAGEYDEWYRGEGRFADRLRPGWHEELGRLVDWVSSLPPARTVDVGCGTGYLSAHLRGQVVGVDLSPAMLAIAARRKVPGARGDALALPIASGAAEQVFTAHFYGHLLAEERRRFLAEAGRVAGSLVVVDSARRDGTPGAGWQERILNDGSRHVVFKRYLRAADLAAELGGEVLFEGEWFVAARTSCPAARAGQRGATSATSARAIETGTTTAPTAL